MTGGDRPEWEHRPHLDGLRALAVYLVVGFHAGAHRLSGGFIGVDVFFVLSGYLVTGLIVRDRRAGSFRLTGFYARRVRRLLPAALVNLSVTAVVIAAILSPVEAAEASRSIRSAALYVSNWFFIGESADYFGADIESSPVLQYWSLSVEEQFYLVWPLLLIGLHSITRRAAANQERILRVVVVAAGTASLVAALLIARSEPTRAYFGSDTRAYQLLAGAALALTPGLVTRLAARRELDRALSWLPVALVGALLVLATPVVHAGPVTRGALTTVVTVLLLLSLEATTRGPGRALLSRPAIVYLGQISYGTYLWHWLVLLVLHDAYDPSPLVAAAVAAPVATALASLSYHLVEAPIRTEARLDRRARPVVACGLAASVLVGVVVAPQVLERSSGSNTDAVDGGADGAPTGTVNTVDWQSVRDENTDVFERDTCLLEGREACQLADGAGPTIAIVGDSHAAVLAPMFVDVAEPHDASVWRIALAGCPWTRGLQYAESGSNCAGWQAATYDEVIPELDPDIVVLVDRPVGDDEALVDGDDGLPVGRPDQAELVESRIRSLLGSLRADGRRVVVVEPVPVPPDGDDPLVCLSTAELIEACRFVAPTDPSLEEEVARAVADDDPGVWSLSLDRLVCPWLPICDPVVGGTVVRADDNHLTVAFGRTLAGPVEQFLVDNRVLG